MNDDIVVSKVTSIERCIVRAREEYVAAGSDFESDYGRQDAAILNVIRACEQSLDLANHILKKYKLGVPSVAVESFQLLVVNSIISPVLADKLHLMSGFRNIAVHQYQQLDLSIVESELQTGLDDLGEFTRQVILFCK